MKPIFYITSLLMALWIFSQATGAIEDRSLPYATPIFVKKRMQDFFSQEQQVLKVPNTALFFGASEVECCVDPAILNPLMKKEGWDLQAFNVGMRNVEMEVYLAFVYVLSRHLQEQGKKLEAVFVKVPHTKLTQRYRRYSQRTAMKADQMAELLSYEDLWQGRSLFQDQFLEILIYKTIFFDSSPYIYKVYLRNLFNEAGILRRDEASEKFNSLWFEKDFLERPLWRLESGGVYEWNLPASQASYQKSLQEKQEKNIQRWSNQRLNICCDINRLLTSSGQVEMFNQIVNILKTVSRKVILYHIPEPSEFNNYRAIGYEGNIRYLFSSIKSGTGLPVWEVENLRLEGSDYIDILHLSPSGQKKFYGALFEKLKSNNMQ